MITHVVYSLFTRQFHFLLTIITSMCLARNVYLILKNKQDCLENAAENNYWQDKVFKILVKLKVSLLEIVTFVPVAMGTMLQGAVMGLACAVSLDWSTHLCPHWLTHGIHQDFMFLLFISKCCNFMLKHLDGLVKKRHNSNGVPAFVLH